MDEQTAQSLMVEYIDHLVDQRGQEWLDPWNCSPNSGVTPISTSSTPQTGPANPISPSAACSPLQKPGSGPHAPGRPSVADALLARK